MPTLVDTVSDVVEMYVKVKVARMVGEMDIVQKNNLKNCILRWEKLGQLLGYP